MLKWGAILGAIGFLGGFVGPVIFTPEANQVRCLAFSYPARSASSSGWSSALFCGYCRNAASRFAALLGALPLAIETGPVAELLQLLGAAICGFVDSQF
jgi:hypothetical protein